jgi:hypothetical protein
MEQTQYDTLSKEEKLQMAPICDDEDFIYYAFYDEDIHINLALCQNERLPLGKLKKYTNSKDLYLKQKAIEVYERRLVY